MKQVISYSLYGNRARYLIGAIKNAQLAQRFFPGFTVRFYVGNSVPTWCRSTLELFPNVEMIRVDEREDSLARLWRFRAIFDPQVDVVLSRDADARLSYREAIAHQEFLDSDFGFHIIRDHPTGHGYLISAGMFAMKNAKYGRLMYDLISSYEFRDEYMADQNFMASQFYPHIAADCLIHDQYYNYQPTPPSEKRVIKRQPLSTLSHIGCAVDENDVYVYQADRDMAIQETGHVTYIYDWGKDGRTDNR